jgi:hypothetical protein
VVVPTGDGKIVLLVEVLTGEELPFRIGGGQKTGLDRLIGGGRGMKPVQIGDTHFGKPVSSVGWT